MLFRKRTPIGLDIGSAYLKAVQINDTKAGYELAMFEMAPVHRGGISESGVLNKSILVDSIKELMEKVKVKKADVVVGISGHSAVIIKRITIPLMTEDELSTSIRYEAAQHIPFDINDVNVDFQILGPRVDYEGQMDIVLVAAKKTSINDYVGIVETAGLNPVVVDVNSFALSNMYEVNYEVNRENVALINVGASTISIDMLQKGQLIFTRDSGIGSNHHTEALEKAFGVSREDAERLKRGYSLSDVSAEIARRVINTASDEIYAEIYRHCEYFRSAISDEEINKIILSGGTALINGFTEMMEERLGIKVEVANPFRNIRISEKLDEAYIRDTAPIAAIAVGLALRRIWDR